MKYVICSICLLSQRHNALASLADLIVIYNHGYRRPAEEKDVVGEDAHRDLSP
jgi:hypothetical protein